MNPYDPSPALTSFPSPSFRGSYPEHSLKHILLDENVFHRRSVKREAQPSLLEQGPGDTGRINGLWSRLQVKESWKYSNDEGDVDGWMRILSTKLVVSVDDIGLLKSDWRLAREVSSKLVR
jgi:hypothetical protein